MTTQQLGELAHLKVKLRAIEKGWVISEPAMDCRYDFIMDDGTRLYRTQVKYASTSWCNAKGSVRICLRKRHKNTALRYTREQVDLILAYLPAIDKIVCLKPDDFDGKSNFTVRISPALNGATNVNLVEQFLW